MALHPIFTTAEKNGSETMEKKWKFSCKQNDIINITNFLKNKKFWDRRSSLI